MNTGISQRPRGDGYLSMEMASLMSMDVAKTPHSLDYYWFIFIADYAHYHYYLGNNRLKFNFKWNSKPNSSTQYRKNSKNIKKQLAVKNSSTDIDKRIWKSITWQFSHEFLVGKLVYMNVHFKMEMKTQNTRSIYGIFSFHYAFHQHTLQFCCTQHGALSFQKPLCFEFLEHRTLTISIDYELRRWCN